MGAIALPVLLSAAGGVVSNMLFAPKASSIGSPTPAPKSNEAANKQRADAAANLTKKKAAAAGGRADSLLTGPGGLGELEEKNKSVTTLLGY